MDLVNFRLKMVNIFEEKLGSQTNQKVGPRVVHRRKLHFGIALPFSPRKVWGLELEIRTRSVPRGPLCSCEYAHRSALGRYESLFATA
jgi:hypothetical protein